MAVGASSWSLAEAEVRSLEMELATIVGERIRGRVLRDPLRFQRHVEARLRKAGFVVKREVMVDSRGTPDGYRGRIDIVVGEPAFAAIEVDRHQARQKSIYKTGRLPGVKRYIVLREPRDCTVAIDGIDRVFAVRDRGID